ncbi:hypothetical protein ATCC90586_004608 [Pythium insidiosum]|nr:hypothetical protein ATCC90586_004608 [Pythium insidiosum]
MSADAASTNDVNVEVKPQTKSQQHQAATYKVLCCGNSALDLVLIPLCLIGVYAMSAALFALCTRAVLQTDDTSAALWMFFGIFVAFVVMLGIVLGINSYEKEQKKKHAEDGTE